MRLCRQKPDERPQKSGKTRKAATEGDGPISLSLFAGPILPAQYGTAGCFVALFWMILYD